MPRDPSTSINAPAPLAVTACAGGPVQRDGLDLQAGRLRGGPGRGGAEGLVALLVDQIGDEVAVWPDLEPDHRGHLHGGHDPQRGTADDGLPGGPFDRPQ